MSQISKPRTPNPQPHIIGVIVGLDLIGDALIKLPFLRALRRAFPKAEIHWITAKGPTAYAGPLREATRGLIDVVDECPSWMEAGGQRSEARKNTLASNLQPPASPFFDLLIDTRNRWREALRARALPHRLFLAPAMRYLFSGRRPNIFRQRPEHLVDRLLELVELASGLRPLATGALPVPAALLEKARALLPEGRIYVGIAPGAGNPIKIWPLYQFAQVARAQVDAGRVPVFILGPRELGWHDELRTAVPTAQFPLQNFAAWGAPMLTFDHTLALGSCLDVALANDSGTGHMLAAVDCPLVSLFGPTSPAKLAPRVSHGIIICAQDFGSSQMQAIRPEAVNAAVGKLLNETRKH